MRVPMPQGRSGRILLIYSVVVLAAFLLVTLLGISQSSIGIGTLQMSGQQSSDVLAGTPRSIRSDEFLRSSPNVLGQAAVGTSDFESPLSADATLSAGSVDDGVAERIVFLDRTLIQVAHGLPDNIQFAFYWWQWIAIAAIFLPVVLRLWGVPLPLVAFATFAALVSPGTAWWSFSPVQPLAMACVVAACIGLASRPTGRLRPLWLGLLITVAGICLARLPFLYFPFAFPIAVATIVPMVAFGVARASQRGATLIVAFGTLAVGAGLALMVLVENDTAVAALTTTEYPGERRSAGTLLDLGRIFGAPFLGILQDNPDLLVANQSELSSSWSVLSVAALLIVAANRPVRTSRYAVLTLGFVLAGFFSWILCNWPAGLGEGIPLMSSIPPKRVAAVIGIPVTIGLALALTPLWQRPHADRRDREDPQTHAAGRLRLALAVAAGTALALAAAGSTLQNQYIPALASPTIAVISLAGALGVALMTAPEVWARRVGVGVVVIGIATTTWRVSPLMGGLGDLQGSPTSERLVELAGSRLPEDGYWATDVWESGALLAANGIPALTGDQWTGPSDAWLVLDPDRQYESAWNRGASIIYFLWDPAMARPEITTNRKPDQIFVRLSPCDPGLAELNLRFVMSRNPVQAGCLTSEGTVAYSGTELYVYRVG